jgi:hypothetical protein
LKISQAGTHELTLRPVEAGWQALTLHSLVLRPVKDP